MSIIITILLGWIVCVVLPVLVLQVGKYCIVNRKYKKLLRDNSEKIRKWVSNDYPYLFLKVPLFHPYHEKLYSGAVGNYLLPTLKDNKKKLSYAQKKSVVNNFKNIEQLDSLVNYWQIVHNEFLEAMGVGLRGKYVKLFLTPDNHYVRSVSIKNPLSFGEDTWTVSKSSFPEKFCLLFLKSLDEFILKSECDRIKKSYPEGVWCCKKYNTDASIVENEKTIELKDIEINSKYAELLDKFPYGCYLYSIISPNEMKAQYLDNERLIQDFAEEMSDVIDYARNEKLLYTTEKIP